MDRPTTRTQQPVFLIIVRSLTVPPPLNLRLPNAHTHISLHLLLHDESGSTGSRVFYQPVHTHSINVSSQFDSMRSLVRGRNRIRMRVPSILFVSSSSSSTVELLASTHTNRHAHQQTRTLTTYVFDVLFLSSTTRTRFWSRITEKPNSSLFSRSELVMRACLNTQCTTGRVSKSFIPPNLLCLKCCNENYYYWTYVNVCVCVCARMCV